MTSFAYLSEELRGAKVIVTGASGFIGLNLIRRLCSLDAEVMIIDRIQPAEHFPEVEMVPLQFPVGLWMVKRRPDVTDPYQAQVVTKSPGYVA
jgi:nucleoside-diphosphate-sugar epimerase